MPMLATAPRSVSRVVLLAASLADSPIAVPRSPRPSRRPARPPRRRRSTAQDAFPAATPEAVVDGHAEDLPAVVRLDVAQEIYSEGKRNLRRGIGSGVIIDDEGRILTNYHVAGRAAEIYVTLVQQGARPRQARSATTTGRTWPSCRWTWTTIKQQEDRRSSTPSWATSDSLDPRAGRDGRSARRSAWRAR